LSIPLYIWSLNVSFGHPAVGHVWELLHASPCAELLCQNVYQIASLLHIWAFSAADFQKNGTFHALDQLLFAPPQKFLDLQRWVDADDGFDVVVLSRHFHGEPSSPRKTDDVNFWEIIGLHILHEFFVLFLECCHLLTLDSFDHFREVVSRSGVDWIQHFRHEHIVAKDPVRISNSFVTIAVDSEQVSEYNERFLPMAGFINFNSINFVSSSCWSVSIGQSRPWVWWARGPRKILQWLLSRCPFNTTHLMFIIPSFPLYL